MRYYNNLILSEFIEKPECKKIAELVTSEITTVMGKGENVEQVMRCVIGNGRLYIIRCMYIKT